LIDQTGNAEAQKKIPALKEFPSARLYNEEMSTIYNGLDWQRSGSKLLVKRFLDVPVALENLLEECRYYHLPLGNLSSDTPVLASDVFFARRLVKNNCVLWCSRSDLPDLGGMENDDLRMLTDPEESGAFEVNNPGCYMTACVEISVDSVPVTALLQAPNIHDLEGTVRWSNFDHGETQKWGFFLQRSEATPCGHLLK
jgi:DNA polymerase epsilon subunit 1